MDPKAPIAFLNNLSAEQFIAEYWQKKPLLVRQAFQGLEDEFSAEELAGLSLEPEVESRVIQHSPESDQWQLHHGPFEETFFQGLPETHWTLLVQAVDQWVPALSQFLDQFQFIPSWRIDDLMISYATDQGSVGPHYDQYDVFLIQAQGQRRWQIGPAVNSDNELLPHPDLKILKNMPVEQEYLLEPGDMLYLPPKLAHHGVAQGECMTYSVGFRAPDLKQLLRDYSEHVIENLTANTLLRDPDLTPQSEPAWLDPKVAERLHLELSAMLANGNHFADWLAASLSHPKYPELVSEDPDAELQPDLPSYRDESSRPVLTGDDPDHPSHLYVNGQDFRLDAGSAPLARYLSRHRQLDTAELFSLAQSESALQLLQQMVKLGVIYQPQ